LRLLLDQNLPLALAPILREGGHDVVHTREVGLERAADEQIFEYCCDDRRTLVTADNGSRNTWPHLRLTARA